MKFKKFSQIFVGLLIALAPTTGVYAKGWENLKTERTDTRTVVKENDIEIRTTRGLIIITTNHQLQIKVFTILGQLISSDTIGPGTSQFTVNAHGIYILKAGDLTCKVAL